MATITICDKCGVPILAFDNVYSIKSWSRKKEEFILSPKDIWNPEFNYVLCKTCSKKVHKFIRGSTSD